MTHNKKEHNEIKNESHILNTDGEEKDLLDDNMKKLLKYISLGIGAIILILLFFTYTFFNVGNNTVGVTEGFFSKKVTVYNTSGIKILNPFALDKKTTYPTYIQSISFKEQKEKITDTDIKNTNNSNIKNNGIKNNIYDATYNTLGLRVNTKDEINITVLFSVSYRLKSDVNSVTYVHNNTGNSNFIEKIILPTITSSVSDVYSKYSLMDIVNKNKNKNKDNTELDNDISIGNVLKEKIRSELDNKGFKLETFTFSGINTSDGITQTIEKLFNTQNELELEKTKFKTLELKNKNSLKELELTNGIYNTLKNANLSIDDYQKIKMIQIFEKKWDGSIIPNNLNKLLQ